MLAIPEMPVSELRMEDLDMVLFENVFDDANTLVHGLADYDILGMDARANAASNSNTNGTNGTQDSLKPFHSNIILNEAPKDNAFFNDDELKDYLLNGVDWSGTDSSRFWNQFNEFMTEEKPEMSNVELVQNIIAKYKLSKEEQQYFEEIVLHRLVLYLFPFASTIEDNEVVHVLLEYLLVFKYLVYALMALSASCLFTMTQNRKHDHQQKKYTAVCMRLLVAAFGDLKNNEHSLWHIEGLIMTVLMLTMLFCDMSFVDSAQVPVSWISHLKEAKSLLAKYNQLKQSQQAQSDTQGMVIAKMIFFCYDWISKLSMPVVEVSKDELGDMWLLTPGNFLTYSQEYYRSLLKMKVVIPRSDTHSGFNLLLAMTSEAADGIYKLLEVMSVITARTNGAEVTQAQPEHICKLMASIDAAFQQVVAPGASTLNGYQIERSSRAHPDYKGPDVPIILPTAAYGKDTDDPAETVYYSYCDVSQMLHVYFLYLKVLTTPGLMYVPRLHPMLRLMVQKVIALMFFVKKKTVHYQPDLAVAESHNYYLPKCLFDLRTIMMQLPFRMCIDLTDDDDDFERLELFFQGLLKLGSGNCAAAIARIEKNRERVHKRSLGKTGAYGEFEYLPEGLPIF